MLEGAQDIRSESCLMARYVDILDSGLTLLLVYIHRASINKQDNKLNKYRHKLQYTHTHTRAIIANDCFTVIVVHSHEK